MRKPITAIVSAVLIASAQAQLSNADFETTTTWEGVTVPEGWSSYASFGFGAIADAHTGSYALGVWNWYWYAEGFATNGVSVWPASAGTPLSGQPIALTGWFKRQAGQLQEGPWNVARVGVLLTRWNTATHQRDTVAQGEQLFEEQATWAPFSIDIIYSSAETADTIAVELLSCINCMCMGQSEGNCAYFQVDDLALVSSTGIVDALMDESAIRFVSQADGSVQVRLANPAAAPIRLQLWDALGRTLDDRIVRDGQLLNPLGATGVVAYAASTRERTLAKGRFVVY